MKRETIAIHVGYCGDPTTKAVAVPIYQTIAFEFDSAEHGAALFNLEGEGNIYTRIGNPTNAVLEKRVAALESGVDALSVSSGMAAIHYAIANITELAPILSLPLNSMVPLILFLRTSWQNRGSPLDSPRVIIPML